MCFRPPGFKTLVADLSPTGKMTGAVIVLACSLDLIYIGTDGAPGGVMIKLSFDVIG
jgi:hypothetical protein